MSNLTKTVFYYYKLAMSSALLMQSIKLTSYTSL